MTVRRVVCLQEEEEEQLEQEEEDSVKEETAEQEIPNWTRARGRKKEKQQTHHFSVASPPVFAFPFRRIAHSNFLLDSQSF